MTEQQIERGRAEAGRTIHVRRMESMLCVISLAAALLSAPMATADINAASPLPNPEQLRQRALQNFQKTEAQRERYLCEQTVGTQQLDSKGGLKKTEDERREIFFVNGYEIVQVVSTNGKPLSAGEIKKQDGRVRKEIEKYQKAGPRRDASKNGAVSVRDVLRLMKFNNEKREFVDGRPIIYFDVSGDSASKAGDVEQRVLQAMQGNIRIDEQTGVPVDINVHGVRDVKVGGGLVASVHKGFLLRVQLKQHADGVWLVDRAEGSGDARIGLFFHPYFRFKQQTGACKLFNASAEDFKNR